MDLEILTIGTELLLGFTLDTNGGEIAQALSGIGVRVARRTSVPDDPDAIKAAVDEALSRTGAVLTTGGLGPTRDDITKKCVAELLGLPLEFQEPIWQELLARYARHGRKPAASNQSQAEVPRGALVLPNRRGTAPGLWIEGPRGVVILLPGVPLEMRELLSQEVVPRLAQRVGGRVIRSRTIRTSGIAESSLAELLGDIENQIAPLTLAYLPSHMGVDLRLTAWDEPAAATEGRLATEVDRIRALAGRYVYGEGEDDLAAVLLDQVRRRGQRIAVAESCTGGMIGARITAVPGSSDVFVGGIIAYDDAVKRRELDIDEATLRQHGSVSEESARAMATGVVARFKVDLGVAVTGIAGPTGETAEKPIGLVYFATSVAGDVQSLRYVFPGTREEIRVRAAQTALFQLYQRLH